MRALPQSEEKRKAKLTRESVEVSVRPLPNKSPMRPLPDKSEDHKYRMWLSERSSREEYWQYKAFVERAAECFGDDLTAGFWLSTPSVDLDGKVPMQVAQDVGYSAEELERIFEPIFVRIEHGIYW